MFDAALRRLIDPPINHIAGRLSNLGVSANMVTVLGAMTGLTAAFSVTEQQFAAALALIFVNRIFDGIDGAVARIEGPTEWGGYVDTLADYLFYISVPVAFGWTTAQNQMPALLLASSFTLTAVSFLAIAAIIAKRDQNDSGQGQKAFVYTAGLMEGGETIAFFVVFCLFPEYFPALAILFAVLCIATVAQRIAFAAKTLR